MRFQIKPNDKPCEIRIHIRLLDQNNPDQMEALGKIGVNLIYAAFKYRDDLKLFAESLVDDISPNRVEVDLLRFEEEPFRFIDNRLCALQWSNNLTETVIQSKR